MKEAIPYSLEYYLNIKINENDKEYVDVWIYIDHGYCWLLFCKYSLKYEIMILDYYFIFLK
jgi:hypothetical protein